MPGKHALALIGVRRSGKTWSAVELTRNFDQPVLYYNFEDPLFYSDPDVLNLDELISIYVEQKGSPPALLILDEIQNVNGWERWVRKMTDLEKYKIVITGSSAKLLSSEISTSLAGRALEEKIWTLSFPEFLKFRNRQCRSEDEYLAELHHYMEWGSFPEVVLCKSETEKKRLLQQYLNDIVLKDIVNRHELRAKKVLDQLLLYYFTNISSLHSYSRIQKAFGTSTHLASEYTSYFEEAFLVFEVYRYHPNLKIQARDPKKIYVIDPGLRNTFASSISPDFGKLAENVVFIQLKRLGLAMSYFKNLGEVDFLVTESGKPLEAIQVCYSDLRDPAVYKREVQSLLECLETLKLPDGKILTLKRHEKITLSGKQIQFIPLYHWLLQAKSPKIHR
ncbi:MAG: ATP-binding protein [Deltaproteobacteria bacterium]|nr:ATP-binding protein [Deltaproteobacteria bacterium]